MKRGLADTSLFIAREAGRHHATDVMPKQLGVSVVTVAELRAGVLAASDLAVRRRRLRTLEFVLRLDCLPVDEPVAEAWAVLRVALRDHGRRMNVNDAWIAATALAHDLPVVTQDHDFDVVRDLGVSVIHV